MSATPTVATGKRAHENDPDTEPPAKRTAKEERPMYILATFEFDSCDKDITIEYHGAPVYTENQNAMNTVRHSILVGEYGPNSVEESAAAIALTGSNEEMFRKIMSTDDPDEKIYNVKYILVDPALMRAGDGGGGGDDDDDDNASVV
jgi:hypothetical protein